MPVPPKTEPDARQRFIARILSDTGFFCREVLGMHTDRDENGEALSEVGKGGIRAYGPHQKMVEFVDDEDKPFKMLWAPRYSYKSSLVTGYILRTLLRDPNVCVLLMMHDLDMAEERCRVIRDIFEQNEVINELFPGPKRGKLWRNDRWISGLRTDKTNLNPSLYVGAPGKIRTGSRPNRVIWDDIVSDLNSKSEIGREDGIRAIEKVIVMRARGAQCIDIGTPYHYGDAHHHILGQPPGNWDCLVDMDVGFDVQVNEDKSMSLVGEGRWENLSKAFLEEQLRGGVRFDTFMSQYKLRVVSGYDSAFKREHFQPIPWSDKLRDCTGYLLTDIAPGGVTVGDYNVLMYLGVNQDGDRIILDLEVGHWTMLEWCERYLNMLARWSSKVTHRAELWERNPAAEPYRQYLVIEGKRRGQRANVLWQVRNQTTGSKEARIYSTQVQFQSGRVYVCNTVPKVFTGGTKVRTLWDPEGDKNPQTGATLPGGELVDQFVMFPNHPFRDIPDTFALSDSEDKETSQRICYWIRPSTTRPDPATLRVPVHSSPTQGRGTTARFYDRVRQRRR